MIEQEMQREIRNLLREKNAILLAHYYQRDEVQEIADYVGDSLGLSIEAARTDAEIIVFAGVHFMAESAAILSPDKTVLLPRQEAGCPLADMITEAQLAAAREKYPTAAVVTYINSSAAIKAASDICCTSANARKVVQSLPGSGPVLMIPDGNLARYVAGQTGRQIIPWEGYCPVHNRLNAETVSAVRKLHPDAAFAAHPECRQEVLALADFIGSTTGIIAYAGGPEVKKLIVGTERGVFYRLQSLYPEKIFIPAADDFLCPDMKLTTLEDILNSLRDMRYVVAVPEEVRIPARRALDRMLALA
ncbi:MAG: quinolinate synthase NadA [Syntrophobacterales bacterium]|nr:quinolinate synthase NadA [Syntrophobacterales bacterium]